MKANLSNAKNVIIFLAVVDLVFWSIAILVTFWGLSAGVMVEKNANSAILLNQMGLLNGTLRLYLYYTLPILLCLGFSLLSPLISKKIGYFIGETPKERHQLHLLLLGIFFCSAFTVLFSIAVLVVPDGLHDLIVLVKVLAN